MSESDLDDLLNDLDIPDAGDEGREEEGSTDPGDDIAAMGDADTGGGEGIGEGIEVDDELAAEIGEADAGGNQEDDLTSSLLNELGVGDEEGDTGAVDDMSALADSLGSGDAGGGEAAAVATLPQAALAGLDPDSVNVEFLLELKLHITFEVGRAKMLISDLLTLGQGSVIELHRLVGDELDFMVNGKLVAKGEVVVVNEKFGCRITSIVPPEDRVKYLSGV